MKTMQDRPAPCVGRGFTLIELLIVIAVIAILASILFPVFARVRENGRKISCLSNCKQLGMAFLQYTQDYDERMPQGTQLVYLSQWRLGVGWGGQIYPYARSTQLFKCPSDPTTATAPKVPVSYGANDMVLQDDTATAVSLGGVAGATHISLMNAPTKTVLLFEMQGSQADVANPLEAGGSPHTCVGVGDSRTYCNGGASPTMTAEKYATGYLGGKTYTGSFGGAGCTQNAGFVNDCMASAEGRHLAGANYVMCDGHAKWYRGNQVSPGGRATDATDVQTSNVAAGTANNAFAVTFSNK